MMINVKVRKSPGGLNILCVLTTSNSRAKSLPVKLI